MFASQGLGSMRTHDTLLVVLSWIVALVSASAGVICVDDNHAVTSCPSAWGFVVLDAGLPVQTRSSLAF
jgi:hypothetical protein